MILESDLMPRRAAFTVQAITVPCLLGPGLP